MRICCVRIRKKYHFSQCLGHPVENRSCGGPVILESNNDKHEIDSKLDSRCKGMNRSRYDNSATIKELDISDNMTAFDPFDPWVNEKENLIAENERTGLVVNEFDPASSLDYYEFKLCGKKKFAMNKELLTFRITQFIWYGGGILPSTFLGIFLKQRGLTLVELSSVFSMIFLIQFACSLITGIITDKIGKAKPVLMFLMFSTFIVLLSMLLTPNINSTSCILQNYLNNFDLSYHGEIFSSCYTNCSLNYRKKISEEENFNLNSIIKNLSRIDNNIDDSKSACNFYSISLTNTSLDSSGDDCCNVCVNSTKAICVEERSGFRTVVYVILILLFYSVYSTTYRFMNFTAVSLAEKNDSDFGKEYAVAKSADLLFIIITAFVINNDKSSGTEINFNPVIWIASGIMFCACLTLFTTSVPILPPGKNLMKKAFDLIKDIDTLAFILLVFVAGNGHAFYLTFHLVFLETLNASSTLIALHSVVIVLYGFLLVLTSKWWLKKFGANKIFVLSLLFCGINFAGNSYIYNPWWTLIIDISVAFAFDLYWVAVVEHSWSAAPVGFAATYIAFTGTVQNGIGRSSGVFFGGMLMNYMGPRTAYRIMATACFATAILYSIFVHKRKKSVVAR